jgi:hypothetical protein
MQNYSAFPAREHAIYNCPREKKLVWKSTLAVLSALVRGRMTEQMQGGVESAVA